MPLGPFGRKEHKKEKKGKKETVKLRSNNRIKKQKTTVFQCSK